MDNVANKTIWDNIKYFNPEEFADPNYPGSGKLIHLPLVIKLDHLRTVIKRPCITHWKVGGCVDVKGEHGHAEQSFHRLDMGAMACDFHFDCNILPREQYYYVEREGFGGIGVYYDWHWDGKLLSIGFHVDMRQLASIQRWVHRDDEYFYLLGR